jgi:DNA-binding XRE family transcriptional regulator
MSVHMKTRPTEIQVVTGSHVRRFRDVPPSKLRPLLTLLKDYEDDSVPWRELAKDRIESAGSEGAYTARKRLGLTQQELAEKLKMPQGNVSQLEVGKRPIGKALAKRLSKVLELDYRVFL